MEMNYPVKRSGQETGREDSWTDRRAGVKFPRRDRWQSAGAKGSLGWRGGVRRQRPYNSNSGVGSVSRRQEVGPEKSQQESNNDLFI